jgi:phosphotransferase system HPr (HPr) family protein
MLTHLSVVDYHKLYTKSARDFSSVNREGKRGNPAGYVTRCRFSDCLFVRAAANMETAWRSKGKRAMKEMTYTIQNPVWMHPGTAFSFTMRLEDFSSTIIVSRGGESRNGKDFFELMKLRSKKSETTEIKIDGADEEAVAQTIVEFMNEHTELR